jgi:pimeloyl-ACP methyl ester carboxylesterase
MAEFVCADGIRLAYETAGTGDPPIIFVHGWSCDRSYFAPQFGRFAASHAVAALDLRGHGGSSQPAPDPGSYGIDVLAGDVLALAGAAGFTRPVLAGHSLGALIGLACAARPGAIRGLVMVEPAPITNERAKAFFLDSVAAVRSDDDRSWRTAFINGMFLPTDAIRREAIVNQMLDVSPGIAGALMEAMGEFDGASALSKAAVPVLSIGSAVPANKSADLRRLCPSITVGQTVGAGHFNQLEVPEQVNSMIERFLAINGLSPQGRRRTPAST